MDNSILNKRVTDGDEIAADDIGGVKYQRMKISVGAAGSATDVSSANPLPVSVVGGGDATAANQATEIAKLTSIDGKTPALGQALAAASSPVVLTAAQVATLTPPAAITGFATEVTVNSLLKPSSTLAALGSITADLDNTSSGSLTAASQNVILLTSAKSAAAVVITGAWAGTITFEGSVDGITWGLINATASSTSQPQPTTTVNGLYRLTPGGLYQIRVNMTLFTSGTAIISMRASKATGGTFVNQILPVAIISNPATASPTYSAVAGGINSALSATDLVTIYGSATKTINILNIIISGVQATASQILFLLVRRSSVNTGGTSTLQTNVPYDTTQAASTATVLAYTANPTTLGTVIGNVRRDRTFIPGAASASYAQGLDWKFTNSKNLMLKGVSEGICINLNGEQVTGSLFNITIEWTET